MKVAEFIAKFGWEEASEVVAGLPEKLKTKNLSLVCYDNNTYKYSDRFSPRRSLVNMGDMKSYVSAWELVHKDFGSVEMASYEHLVSGSYADPYWIDVKKAIALVEEVESLKEVS